MLFIIRIVIIVKPIAQRVLILREGNIIVDETLEVLLNSKSSLKDKNIGSEQVKEKLELDRNEDEGFTLTLEEVFINIHLQTSQEKNE